MAGALNVTPEDLNKIKEIQNHIKASNFIMAIVESTVLAMNLTKNTYPDIQGEEYNVAVEKFAGDIFLSERKRIGLEYKLKKRSTNRKVQ